MSDECPLRFRRSALPFFLVSPAKSEVPVLLRQRTRPGANAEAIEEIEAFIAKLQET